MRAHWIAITSLLVACDGSTPQDHGAADAAVAADPDAALDTIDAAVDPTAPTVTAISPAADAIGVAPDAVIEVTFSADLAAETIDATTFLVAVDGAPVPGTITYASRVATLHPQRRLVLLGGYTVRVTRGITDAAGTPLAAERAWSFAVRDGAWDAAGLVLADDDGSEGVADSVAAVDAAGNATIVLEHDGSVDAVRFEPATGWGAAASLSDAAAAPAIAALDDGDLVAVWQGGSATAPLSLFARAYAAGAWGAPMAVEDDDTYAHHVGDLPRAVADPTGGVLAIWDQYDEGVQKRIWVRRYTPAAGWDDAVALGTGANPWVVVDAAGNATAAWMHADDPAQFTYSIWASHRAANGAWSTAAAISSEIGGASRVRLAAADAGDVTAVWEQDQSIWTNRFTIAAGWTGATLLETGSGFATAPDVAADPDGDVIAVWYQARDTGGVRAWARTYVPGAGWGTATALAGDTGAAYPQIAIDRAGHAIAVWLSGGVWAGRYVKGVGWGAPVSIDTNDDGESGPPQLAIGASGDAVVLWYRSIGPSQSGVLHRTWRAVFH